MTAKRKKLLKICKEKLLSLKTRYESTLSTERKISEDKADIIDMASREIQVQNSSYFRSRTKNLLDEVNYALNRLKNGTYGVCEISGELIEEKRLLAVPYARISVKALELEAS